MSLLLDTSTLSDIVRGIGRSVEHSARAGGMTMCISSVSVMEAHYGMALNPALAARIRDPLTKLLASLEVLDFDAQSAETAGRLRAELRRQGKPVGPYDLLIAGAALAHRLTLITSNDAELRHIPGLAMENWR